MEAEHVVVIRLHHAIDHHRQGDGLSMLEVIVGLGFVLVRKRSHVENANVRAARSPQPVVMQADRHLRADRNASLDREEIRRKMSERAKAMSRVSLRLRPEISTSSVSAGRAPNGKTEITMGLEG